MRQDERRARTRRQLIAAARAAFGARGYDGGALDAIAAAAGLSKGAVYAHFATKLDLYLAVVEAELEEALHRVERAADAIRAGAPPVHAAELYGARTHAGLHNALILDAWATATREPKVRELLEAYLQERKTLFAAAAVEAGQRPNAALATAELVGRLIDAEVLHARHRGEAEAGAG